MITGKIQDLIIEGAAVHKVLNVGAGVFNYNLGRGSSVVVEKIKMQNTLKKVCAFVASSATPANDVQAITAELTEFLNSNSIFTVNIYDGNQEQSVTIKNEVIITAAPRSAAPAGFYLIAQSVLKFDLDVFWMFSGENLTIEITEVRNSIQNTQTQNTTPYILRSKKVVNPIGFTLPNPVITSYTGGAFNWSVRQMGKQITQGAAGTLSDGFIIPRQGNGTTGNIVTPITGALANVGQLILNVGIVEINEAKK